MLRISQISNPDFNLDLFNRQDSEVERTGKTFPNGMFSVRVENAGDIIRELLGRKQPAATYISEKLNRIEKMLNYPAALKDFLRPPRNEDQPMIQMLRTWYTNIPNTSQRMVAAKNLMDAVLLQDVSKIQTAVHACRSFLTHDFSPKAEN